MYSIRDRFKNGMDWEGLEEELKQFFDSHELSLMYLHKNSDLILSYMMKNMNLLHRACLHKNVTLEIVQYLSDTCPEAAGMIMDSDEAKSPYPLHLACCNESCPSSVIELLVKEYQSALRKFCYVKDARRGGRLPLHHYLSRTSNMDIETIKMLVKAYPEGLKMVDEGRVGLTPVYTLLSSTRITNMNDIVQFIAETEPSALQMTGSYGRSPLHVACSNKNITHETIQTLIDCWPESITQQDRRGELPIHVLCLEHELDETASLKILALLIKASPFTVQQRMEIFTFQPVQRENNIGCLPIHLASGKSPTIYLASSNKSAEFCKLLVEAYPDSLNIESPRRKLPIHHASSAGRVETVKYLLELHPEHIGRSVSNGKLPIHLAAKGGNAETIKFLLMQDPAAASKFMTGLNLPLHMACGRHGANIVSIVQILFDSYPEAILSKNRDGNTPLAIARLQARLYRAQNSKVIQFLERQMAYARTAQDTIAMTTLDDNGWLPLHHALHDNVTLGAIKLLSESNPHALTVADNQGMLPLHIACEFSSAGVVTFLVAKSNDEDLYQYDENNDSPLHYACRGGNCGVVKVLLERGVRSVSERNSNNKLPVHLLCESDKVERESPEYVETIWLLLLACPETVLNFS